MTITPPTGLNDLLHPFLSFLHVATLVHVLLRWPCAGGGDMNEPRRNSEVTCPSQPVISACGFDPDDTHIGEEIQKKIDIQCKFTTKKGIYAKGTKIKTCLDVDEHSGRHAHEGQMRHSVQTDRMLEEVALFSERLASIPPPHPLEVVKTTSDQ